MALRAKDIADKLQISTATVSLVVNNKPGVSEETRQKVFKAMEEVGYDPAALLKPGNRFQKSIRFVIYKKHGKIVSDTPFFSALIEGIEQETRKAGYNLLISYVHEKENRPEPLRILRESSHEGIILLATEMEMEDLKAFRSLSMPLVILDNCFAGEKLNTVVIGNREGAKEAAEYLLQSGHEELGYLQGANRIHNFEERKNGFLEALTNRNRKLNKKQVISLEPTLEGAYRDMYAVLEEKPALPSAFFAENDILALGAVRALKEHGFRIPEDISVVGFDDMPLCEMCEPPLTTVRVYKQKMGIQAVRMLLEKMEDNQEEAVKIEVLTKVVERKSVAQRVVESGIEENRRVMYDVS